MVKDNLKESVEMKISRYLELKEKLEKNPKEKTSISIDRDVLAASQKCMSEKYKNSSLSRLIEMLLEDFLEFHHPEYLKKEDAEGL